MGNIVNARTKTVSQAVVGAAGPNMRSTLMGYFRDLHLTKVVKRLVAGGVRTEEVEEPFVAQGVWQPFTAEQLKLKPEGERSWRWVMIHSTTDLVLLTDDVIVRDGVKHRVMGKLDFSDQGFVEYHVVNAFDGRGGGQ